MDREQLLGELVAMGFDYWAIKDCPLGSLEVLYESHR